MMDNIEFVLAIAAICEKFGFTGYAGTFRGADGIWYTSSVEAPGYQDGVCDVIQEGLHTVVATVTGAVHLSHTGGSVIKPSSPDEMPH